MLIILSISSIVYASYQSNNGVELYQYPVYYVTPAVLTATFVRILKNLNNSIRHFNLFTSFFFTGIDSVFFVGGKEERN